jgi:phosphoserine aminotransferase
VTASGERRTFNFAAGPAVLPEPVLRRAQAAIWDLHGTGIGVMEHSHRGKAFQAVADRAEALVRKVGGVPDSYAVLFLQGGASSQFYQVPMSFLGGGTADYVNTGVWSQKAIAEARRYGTVHVAASTEASRFDHVPAVAELAWSSAPVYAHYTSNNTIVGTQFHEPMVAPDGVPLVCDASSDIYSRPLDVARHAFIYGGAQKNLGPSGVTVVIARRDFLERGSRDLPTMLQYRTHVAEGSMYNTPPTFGLYVLGEVMAWIDELGGLPAMAERNQAKAAVLYDFLDQSTFFRGTARVASRSLMNVTFRAASEALESQFIAEATAAGLDGLKGHRLVGGMRASIYNAFPIEGVRALVTFMQDFERQHRGAA